MCLLGLIDIAPHLGSQIPTETQFWGVKAFSSRSYKILKLLYAEF